MYLETFYLLFKTFIMILSFLVRYSQLCERGYNFDEETKDNTFTSDFTQLVWKSTTKLGVGMTTTTRNHMLYTIVVARYEVAGNEAGKYKKNVLEGLL